MLPPEYLGRMYIAFGDHRLVVNAGLSISRAATAGRIELLLIISIVITV